MTRTSENLAAQRVQDLYRLLPGVNEVPDGFPAVTLWDFRVASVAIQAVTWATVGLVFAGLAERALEQRPPPTPARRRAVTSR